MTEPLNIREMDDDNYIAALLIDVHREYPIFKCLQYITTEQYYRVDTVYNGFFLEDYTTESALKRLYHRIIDAHPKSEVSWIHDDPYVQIYRIYAHPEGHIKAIQALVQMMIDNLSHVRGDDTYFDYFPNTVGGIETYADDLGCIDLLKPLAEAIFNDNSPYIHSDDYEGAYDLFDLYDRLLIKE